MHTLYIHPCPKNTLLDQAGQALDDWQPRQAPARAMPDLPVALLTSTQVAEEPFVFEETAEGKSLWKAQHATLFAGVSRGSHRYFSTGHNIHRDNPRAVTEAIREIAGDRD